VTGGQAKGEKRVWEWIRKAKSAPPDAKAEIWVLYDAAVLSVMEVFKRVDELVECALPEAAYAIAAEIGVAVAEAVLTGALRSSGEDGSISLGKLTDEIASLFQPWFFLQLMDRLEVRSKMWYAKAEHEGEGK